MGLIERAWVDCLGSIDPEEVEVMDPVEEGSSIAQELILQVCWGVLIFFGSFLEVRGWFFWFWVVVIGCCFGGMLAVCCLF